MFIGKDILKLNLDLTLTSSDDDDFFESDISSKFEENDFSYQTTINDFLKQKIRKMKTKIQQIDNEITNKTEENQNLENQQYNDDKSMQQNLVNQPQTPKNDSSPQTILQQERFGSYTDEITSFSKIQFQRVTKVKKYNTNLHGFNRIGARQLFIRTIVDVNPEFNVQYIYNTGIGTHSEKENVISKVIQSTVKSMFGQDFELETSTNNQGLLEFRQNSNIYSENPTQEQLKMAIFRDFDPNNLI